MNEKDRIKRRTEGARDCLTIIRDKATNDIHIAVQNVSSLFQK